MHFLNKLNIIWSWLLAVILFSIMCFFPGSPFVLVMLVPVLFCALFPDGKFQIVFFFTLLFGVFFLGNFFSIHIYGNEVLSPLPILFPLYKGMEFSWIRMASAMSLAVVVYLIIFICIISLMKRWLPRFNFWTSTLLVLLIYLLSWLSSVWLEIDQFWSIVFALSIIMLSRHCFYLFNYLRFFKTLPGTKEQFFSMFQPFWFLNFEIPENPVYEIDRDNSKNITSALQILLSCFAFKLALTAFSTVILFLFKGEWALIYDAGVMESHLFFPIFKNWRSESFFVLLSAQFSYALLYLFNNFFIYGRVMVALGRLCGFNLPDYIDAPWKSHSFADFFSRTMYYYNIIIVNHFLYPALEFSRIFNLSKKMRLFVSLNWALIFGGFFARFLKDIFRIYKIGFIPSISFLLNTSLLYLIFLSLLVSLSLNFQKRVRDDKNRIFQMFFYVFIYSLIMPFNFSRLMGSSNDIFGYYLKIFSLGLAF